MSALLQSLFQGIQATRCSLTRLTITASQKNGPSLHMLSINLTANSQRCCIHTSPVCHKVLYRRLVPDKNPSSKSNRWEPRKKMSELYEYTTKPLPLPNLGGRGPNGRIWNHKRGGGNKKNFRMIDWVRGRNVQGKTLVEKVEKICYDPYRSANIALVAAGEKKRYILATQNMKPGDLIKTSTEVTKIAVRAGEGDAHPVGSLPLGSIINSVEIFPGEGAHFVRAAGTTGQLIRKVDNKCVIRLPSKREILVSFDCMATLGRVSNINHNKLVYGKAGRRRWLGFRPRSGRWQRKTGRFGRKIKPIKPMMIFDKPRTQPTETYRMN